ncbi:MAG: hypothetical protein ACI9YE_000995 [Psychroserpens sp.]
MTSVNSTLESSTQSFYEFSFNWEDLGLTSPNEFSFVGLYVSNTAYSSDEGYGEGIAIGTEGSDAITFTGYLTLPGCDAVLSTLANLFSAITRYYVNGQLFIKGINELAIISIYDLQVRELFRNQYQIPDAVPIPFELNNDNNKLQFIIIGSSNKRKVLKVISN